MLRPILYVPTQGVFTAGQLRQGGSGAAVTGEGTGKGRGSDLNRGTGVQFTAPDLSASVAFT